MTRLASIAVALAGAALASAGAHAQADTNEPSAAVKSCIAANAPAVDLVFDSLTEGADFLVLKVCAGEISEQIQEASATRFRKQQEDAAAKRKAMCEARDEENFDAINNPANPQYYMAMICAQPADLMMDAGEHYLGDVLYSGANAPKATALAAKTLLDLRAKRLKPR